MISIERLLSKMSELIAKEVDQRIQKKISREEGKLSLQHVKLQRKVWLRPQRKHLSLLLERAMIRREGRKEKEMKRTAEERRAPKSQRCPGKVLPRRLQSAVLKKSHLLRQKRTKHLL